MDFAPHSRPASPVDVSVYVGAGGITLDPRKLSPGPVEFNITNQSAKAVRVAVMFGDGRTLTRSPQVPAGGTAQLKATLTHHSFGLGLLDRPSSLRRLTLAGRARTGDNELTQP